MTSASLLRCVAGYPFDIPLGKQTPVTDSHHQPHRPSAPRYTAFVDSLRTRGSRETRRWRKQTAQIRNLWTTTEISAAPKNIRTNPLYDTSSCKLPSKAPTNTFVNKTGNSSFPTMKPWI